MAEVDVIRILRETNGSIGVHPVIGRVLVRDNGVGKARRVSFVNFTNKLNTRFNSNRQQGIKVVYTFSMGRRQAIKVSSLIPNTVNTSRQCPIITQIRHLSSNTIYSVYRHLSVTSSEPFRPTRVRSRLSKVTHQRHFKRLTPSARPNHTP